jgi:hypothetical protein
VLHTYHSFSIKSDSFRGTRVYPVVQLINTSKNVPRTWTRTKSDLP